MNEDKAARYQRLKRRSDMIGLAWSVVFLAGLLASGLSAGLRDAARALVPGSTPVLLGPTFLVLVYVALLAVVNEIGSLPLAFYSGFLVERRYGLSNQSLGGWLGDQLKGFVLSIVLGGAAASILYFFVRRSADSWWWPAGLVFAVLIVGLTNLAPVLLLPMFYTVKPLTHESLKARLMKMAERAGARVLGVYEWGLGKQTKKANAALTGLGSTRRILVSDTMLAEYSEEEIEVVLAHELAHHVHNDIWKGLALQGGLILAGFFVASRLLAALAGMLGLEGVTDVAGLPLLLLSAGAVSLVMMPVAHALSRAHERSADRFALELTHNPAAFISAMKRLGAQNLAEEHPSKIVQWLFHSHPPVSERVAAAQRFKTS